ncbi:aldo/keto reductase [Streptomyces sp. WI04-05B]|uniref:aldo/keto reductase n=1 Tax=Streptomyces TaxID=1883 RepID=UPI0029A6309A|nr:MULTISPECIES: aldo/keto reductase [unclassified Streptomyces]MDX2542806.1 aldo/keto reductase [Streptomyces sp. WI04-05B]MDX2588350.1 aldo/keto reductase [Streptomyces sp. WI04-05A]
MNDQRRTLVADGPEVSALGLGTWALGGPSAAGDQPLGWGERFDRAEAADVFRAAYDSGITLYDTADAYGTGTAERLIGETLSGKPDKRDRINLVSKWGNTIDEEARQLTGQNATPGYVRQALEASLGRLRTDYLDLYLLHLSGLPVAEAEELLGTLQDLVKEGSIRAYGWSTDEPELAAAWVGRPGFGGLEFEINVVHDAPALVQLCETHGIPGLARGPLGTGLLTGAHPMGSLITDEQDFRRRSPDWLNYFKDGAPVRELAEALESVRHILTSEGRTLAQGSLAWLWARSPALLPVPGARTVAQVRENAGALEHGPLTPDQMREIDGLLGTASG